MIYMKNGLRITTSMSLEVYPYSRSLLTTEGPTSTRISIAWSLPGKKTPTSVMMAHRSPFRVSNLHLSSPVSESHELIYTNRQVSIRPFWRSYLATHFNSLFALVGFRVLTLIFHQVLLYLVWLIKLTGNYLFPCSAMP